MGDFTVTIKIGAGEFGPFLSPDPPREGNLDTPDHPSDENNPVIRSALIKITV